jgi:hypothetical protein
MSSGLEEKKLEGIRIHKRMEAGGKANLLMDQESWSIQGGVSFFLSWVDFFIDRVLFHRLLPLSMLYQLLAKMKYINHQISILTMASPIEYKAGLLWRWAPIDRWVCSCRPRRYYPHWRLSHLRELRRCDQPCDSPLVFRKRASLPRTWAGRR